MTTTVQLSRKKGWEKEINYSHFMRKVLFCMSFSDTSIIMVNIYVNNNKVLSSSLIIILQGISCFFPHSTTKTTRQLCTWRRPATSCDCFYMENSLKNIFTWKFLCGRFVMKNCLKLASSPISIFNDK